jgi:hypothetical protein
MSMVALAAIYPFDPIPLKVTVQKPYQRLQFCEHLKQQLKQGNQKTPQTPK